MPTHWERLLNSEGKQQWKIEIEISPGSGKEPRQGAGVSALSQGMPRKCGTRGWCCCSTFCFTCREPGPGPRCLHLLAGVWQHVIAFGFVHQIPASLRRLYQLLIVNNIQQIAGMDEGEPHHRQQLRSILWEGEMITHAAFMSEFSHLASPLPCL